MPQHRRDEHELVSEINEQTDDNVRAYAVGYSGNSTGVKPDIIVTTLRGNHCLELKNRSGDYGYIEAADCEQLVECANDNTIPWLVIDFNRWEPICVRHYQQISGVDGWSDMTAAEQFAKLIDGGPLSASVTDGGNLRVDNPRDSEDWSSKRSGRSTAETVVDMLGL